MDTVKIGLVGCGDISGIYLKNCCKRFKNIDIVACSDLIQERADAKAEEYDLKACKSNDEIYNDPEIDIVLNLTNPESHAEVCLDALKAGKSVHVEKPLAITRENGKKIKELAEKKGVLAGGAPDTFLGGGIQTCRKLIDDGWIGDPIGATAFMMNHGHESWHPDPEFYYQVGGGPMFDMGPYYLTALIFLMGPVKRVSGITTKGFEERTITSEPKYGKKIDVEVPTFVNGSLEFENGANATLITSFDVWQAQLPHIEIYGTEGTLSVPDPNTFGGPVRIYKPESDEWQEIPLTHGSTDNSRGIGVANMAYALKGESEYRANCNLTYHVLEIMHGFHDSSDQGKHIELESSCEKPEPLPMGLPDDDIKG